MEKQQNVFEKTEIYDNKSDIAGKTDTDSQKPLISNVNSSLLLDVTKNCEDSRINIDKSDILKGKAGRPPKLYKHTSKITGKKVHSWEYRKEQRLIRRQNNNLIDKNLLASVEKLAQLTGVTAKSLIDKALHDYLERITALNDISTEKTK